MKSEITKRGDTSATLKITVDQTALSPMVRRTYDEMRGRVKAAGFRPGKAPDHIVERELGANSVQAEVLEQAVMHSYAEAVKQHELPVIAPPEVSIDKFVPYTELEYTAAVDIMPKVKLADYKHLKIKRPEVKVEEAEVEQVIQDLRKRLAKRQPADRPAQSGDEVIIDFAGTIDGQPIEGGSATDYTLMIGSDSFIPGFEEQLIGLKAGADKDFDVNFPKDYRATALAGKRAKFHITLKQVNQMELPSIDDAFAGEVSPFHTLERLRADITERLLVEKQQTTQVQFENSVLESLIKDSQFTAPKRLADQQLERMKAEMLNRSGSGLDWDKFLQMAGMTEDRWLTEARPEAERRVGLAMILTDIAREEQLTVTAEELDNEIQTLRTQYTDKAAQAELNRPEVREDVYNHLMASKTIKKILEYVDQN